MLTAALDHATAVPASGCDVSLYSVELDQSDRIRSGLARLLSADEQQRADRFVFDRDRNHFIVCRGTLRQLLASRIGDQPEGIRFSYGPYGKPAVGPTVQFNVSHAAGLAVFAFATAPVGIDVESLDRSVDIEALAARFFAAEEAAELLALPAHMRREAFLNCWTRKEAYIKAIGDGLTCPLSSFVVSLEPAIPARIQWIANDDASAWSMAAFAPAEGYVAAVAARAAFVPSAVQRIRFDRDGSYGGSR